MSRRGVALFAAATCAIVVLRLLRHRRRTRPDGRAGASPAARTRAAPGVPTAVTLDFCRRLPKVELHAHINGSIRASTLEDLVVAATNADADHEAGVSGDKKQGGKGGGIGDGDGDGSALLLRRRREMLDTLKLRANDQRSLRECFAIFDVIHSVVRSAAAVERITRECVEDFAADGCAYLELRSTPRRDVMTAREYVAAVEAGLAQGEAAAAANAWAAAASTGDGTGGGGTGGGASGGIVARLLLSINRGQSPEIAEDTVDLALELAARPGNKYVVGVELSGNPFSGSFAAVRPALARARAGGLQVALHAAEVDNHLETAEMLEFRPLRLGHALCLSAEQVEEVAEEGLHVEICPTSNTLTLELERLEDHPNLATWIARGHPFSINTDDCGVFETTLSREYFAVARAFGVSGVALRAIALRSIRDSFAQHDVKAAVERRIAAFAVDDLDGAAGSAAGQRSR